MPDPFGRTEYVLAGARGIARSLCPVCPQRCSVATVAPNREIIKLQLRKRVAQLPQLLNLGVFSRHFAEGLIGLIECSALKPAPGHTAAPDIIGKSLLAPVWHTIDDLVAPEGPIQLGDQVKLHTLPAIADACEQR